MHHTRPDNKGLHPLDSLANLEEASDYTAHPLFSIAHELEQEVHKSKHREEVHETVPSEPLTEFQKVVHFAKDVLHWEGSFMDLDVFHHEKRVMHLLEHIQPVIEQIDEDKREEVRTYIMLASIFTAGIMLFDDACFHFDPTLLGEDPTMGLEKSRWSYALIAMGIVYPKTVLVDSSLQTVTTVIMSEQMNEEGKYDHCIETIPDNERSHIIDILLRKLDAKEYTHRNKKYVEVELSFGGILKEIGLLEITDKVLALA